jgi:hypothetical protein
MCALVLGSLAGLTGMHFLPTVYASSMLPGVTLTLPANGSTVSGVVLLQAMADGPGVAGLQFRVNGVNVGSEIMSGSCSAQWNTATSPEGPNTVSAIWHGESGGPVSTNTVTVTVTNAGSVISNVAASNITSSSATISWTTSQTASTQVEYGPTAAYGSSTPLDSALVSSHVQTITGLAGSTTYHFRVRSISWNGVLSVSPDGVFVTGSAGSTPPSQPAPSEPPPPTEPSTPPPPTGCTGPDPFANMGGGVCWNGGWMPPGMTPPGSTPNPPTQPGSMPVSIPTEPPPVQVPVPAPVSTCPTPNPFAAMGGGTCYNGGWLPPGMTPPNSAPIATSPSTGSPAPRQPSTSIAPAAPPAGPSTCTTPNPFSAMGGGLCWNGGWLPPGLLPPTSAPAAPSAPSAPSTPAGCVGPDPFATMTTLRGVCVNGGWVPVPRTGAGSK